MNVLFVTLGCPKNTVDSEYMAHLINSHGHILVASPQEAQAVVINTCGFIEDAVQESLEVIRDFAARKAEGIIEKLVVTGCLVQRYGAQIRESIPQVDHLLNVDGLDAVLTVLETGRKGIVTTSKLTTPPQSIADTSQGRRVVSTPAPTAYLKLSEGCDNRCSYCLIPALRGSLRSRASEEIIAEASWLLERGVKELVLIAQDTTAYGLEQGNPDAFPELLQRLATINTEGWIRILYMHPAHITDRIIDTVAAHTCICNYLDIPFQHVDDRILKAMKRRVTRSDIDTLITRIRSRIPDVILRTTFILGFPGESEQEFGSLLSFLEQHQLDHAGFFAYSPEEGTPAALMPGQVASNIVQERLLRAYHVQNDIAFKKKRKFIGKRDTVLVEAFDPDLPAWIARNCAQAPDIDGVVYLDSWSGQTGEWLEVEYIDADAVDLVAAVVNTAEAG